MNRKKLTRKWICSFAACLGPLAWFGYCQSFMQPTMAQPRAAADTQAIRDHDTPGSTSLDSDAKIEEPESGVKLFGDPISIDLTFGGFGWTISNDGSILVAGERSSSLQFWSLKENRILRTLELPEGNSGWFPCQLERPVGID